MRLAVGYDLSPCRVRKIATNFVLVCNAMWQHVNGALHFLRDFDSVFLKNATPIAPIDTRPSRSPEPMGAAAPSPSRVTLLVWGLFAAVCLWLARPASRRFRKCYLTIYNNNTP